MAVRDVIDMIHERIVRILDSRRAALSILLGRREDFAQSSQVTLRDWADLARYWTPLLPSDQGERQDIAGFICDKFGPDGVHLLALFGDSTESRSSAGFFDDTHIPQDEILNSLDWLELRCGETIVRQGEPSLYLFILTTGRISINVESPE